MRKTLASLIRFPLFCLFWLAGIAPAAGQIYLVNPSFEGDPQDATVPVGWFPCREGTTPDILPGFWGVFTEASEGETFVGLITREDGSWESIGQRLPETLKAGECYSLSVDLAHSLTYAGYNEPVRLRVWGGTEKCGQDQLLFDSGRVEGGEWQSFETDFTTKGPIRYLLLEAYFHEQGKLARGNVLIDNIGPVRKCIRAMLDR